METSNGQIVYLLVHERTIHFTVVRPNGFHIVLMQLNTVLLEHMYRVKKKHCGPGTSDRTILTY